MFWKGCIEVMPPSDSERKPVLSITLLLHPTQPSMSSDSNEAELG